MTSPGGDPPAPGPDTPGAPAGTVDEPGSARTPAAKPKRRRVRRIVAWTLGSIAAILVLAIAGFVLWSQIGVMGAEPEPLAAVRADPAIEITDDSAALVLTPADGSTGGGLVYYPGAKVEAAAYAAKLAGVVEAGGTVVIVKPWLNLALFDLRPLSTFTDLAPDVSDWAVGGHSMGGVRACLMTADVDALILFASYCSGDVSDADLAVLSIGGSEDGLSTPQKIDDARHLLPADAELVEIAGASHASFGDYGPQPGDGTPTISDEDMTARLTELVAPVVVR